MKRILLLSSAGCLLLLSSCIKSVTGSGSIITETRTVDAISSVELEGDAEVEVVQGSSQSVTVSGYENLVALYRTNVSNGNLVLRFDDLYYNVRKNNLKVVIVVPDLSSVKSNGSGEMLVHNFLSKAYLYSSINGSGNITINNSSFDKVQLSVNGSGNIQAAGTGSLEAVAQISGSGNIEIACSQKISAHISGSGNIDYWGSPALTDIQVSGSGRVRKR